MRAAAGASASIPVLARESNQDRERAKERVTERVDRAATAIVALGDTIYRKPELGFKEFETAGTVQRALEQLGLRVETGLAITGMRAMLDTGRPGPTVALMAELDAVIVPGHPAADPVTHAAHACGHNAQCAGLVAAATALTDERVLRHLCGRIMFLVTPAEELVELEFRRDLVQRGEIEFMGGKPEFIRLGLFDNVDAAFLVHTSAPTGDVTDEKPVEWWRSMNGLIGKVARYTGRAAHAAAAPHRGVNALKAASLGLLAIDAIRDTFQDEHGVRVHPILTLDAPLVNVVPGRATLEMHVRGTTAEAIADASRKVDRALQAGAFAIGADVTIENTPGYLPYSTRQEGLVQLFSANSERIFGPGSVGRRGHCAASGDIGDVAHLVPAVQANMGGAVGMGHGVTWRIADPVAAFLAPGKALAMTVVDLLWGGGEALLAAVDLAAVPMTREAYLAFQRSMSASTEFRPDELDRQVRQLNRDRPS